MLRVCIKQGKRRVKIKTTKNKKKRRLFLGAATTRGFEDGRIRRRFEGGVEMSGKSPSLSLFLFLILLLLYKTLPPSLSVGRGGGGCGCGRGPRPRKRKKSSPPQRHREKEKKGMLKAQGDASRGIEDSGGGSACQDARFFIPHSSSSPHLFLACLEVRDSACLSSGSLFTALLLTSKYFAST